jgi:hypothetical protein
MPHRDIVQQSTEQTSSNDKTPSSDSDALNMNSQRETVVTIPQDTRIGDPFESSEAVAPEAPPDEPSAPPLEEEIWGAMPLKKSKKKAKKAAGISYSDEPTEPSC